MGSSLYFNTMPKQDIDEHIKLLETNAFYAKYHHVMSLFMDGDCELNSKGDSGRVYDALEGRWVKFKCDNFANCSGFPDCTSCNCPEYVWIVTAEDIQHVLDTVEFDFEGHYDRLEEILDRMTDDPDLVCLAYWV